MLTKNQTWALVVLVLALWVGVALIRGETHPTLTSTSYVVSLLSLVLVLWDRYLWRWKIFRSWLSARPDLQGTWKGELRSDWPDPETGNRSGPIEVYLVIRQTYTSIDARLYSLESESISLSASVSSDAPKVFTVFIVYRNEPRTLLLRRSPIHYGGMRLSARGAIVNRLDGQYWTERRTTGEIAFPCHVTSIAISFTDAASSFELLSDSAPPAHTRRTDASEEAPGSNTGGAKCD